MRSLVVATAMGRALVLLPWRGRTLVGTSESSDLRGADDQGVRCDELDGFLAQIHEAFPALGLEREEVTFVHRGIVPAAAAADGHLRLLGHRDIRRSPSRSRLSA